MLFAVHLDGLYQIAGTFGFLAICIAWLYGGIVLYKYIKTKKRVLFYFFLAIIFTMSPWYPSGIGFIYWVFSGEEIVYPAYVLIGTIGVPIALLSWIQIYMPALHQKYKRVATWIVVGFSIAFYVYNFYFLFFAPGVPVRELIGIKEIAIDIDYKGFTLIFLAISLLISTITGNDFAIASLKEKDDPVLKWKGRFLLISFNLFAIGGIGDGFLPLNAVNLIIFRVLMMLSSTFYYLGFILPSWVKKILKIE